MISISKLRGLLLSVFIAAAVAFGCVAGAIATAARAEQTAPETAQQYVLYVHADEQWGTPNVWAWQNDGGKNAFSSWPGHAMQALTGDDGWYYIYLPSFVDTVIVNCNQGTENAAQTVAVTVESKDAWLTVGEKKGGDGEDKDNYLATVSYEKATTGSAPAYVKAVNVSAYVPEGWEAVGVWAFTESGKNVFSKWPGGAAVKASDGWYNLEIPTVVDGEDVAKVIINENKFADGKQTADLEFDITKLASGFIPTVYIVVDGNSEDMTKAEAQVVYDVKPDVTPKFTVHAKVPSEWLLPSIWAWSDPDGTTAFTNWPGEEMEKNGDWYEYDVPMFVNSIIINAGSFVTEQTVDLKELQAKDMWIVLGAKGADGKYYANVYYTENDALNTANSGSGGSGDDGSLSAGAIAGIVVGAVAAVGVAVAITLILLKKRKNRN